MRELPFRDIAAEPLVDVRSIPRILTDLRIVDEITTFAIRWQLACSGIFEALDDSLVITLVESLDSRAHGAYCFPRAIGSYNQCQGGLKLYGFSPNVVKGTNSVIL